MLCFSYTFILIEYLFPDLTVLTSPQESSAAPIPIIFDETIHAAKTSTFVHGR